MDQVIQSHFWLTSGSHGEPYANWALPGTACGYALGQDGRSSVDAAMLKAVSARLSDMLDWLLPGQRRVSDEHFLSGDEGSDDEKRRWLPEVQSLAKLYRLLPKSRDFPTFDRNLVEKDSCC